MKKQAAARSTRRPALRAKSPSSYHHGDLRRALLDAAEAVLEDVGVEGFTLRECARRAGVSHGAPAHHFVDARGLLSEFTAESFTQLEQLTTSLRRKAAPDAFSQLLATGQAYVDYALAHRARFQLMFRSDRIDAGNEHLARSGDSVYAHLVECMGRVNSESGAGNDLLAHKTTLAWSLVHGFATLMLDNAGFAQQASAHVGGAPALLKQIIELSQSAFEAKQPGLRTSRSRRSRARGA
jgi:AcrR family transcriptional regulator